MIAYRLNAPITVDDLIDVFVDSTLAERRPVKDRARMQAMLLASNLVVTAWQGDRLVGVARSVSDYAYATYVSDLAVRRQNQRQGIGRGLLRAAQAAAPLATVILLAAPAAAAYYPRVGFTRHDCAWMLRPGDQI